MGERLKRLGERIRENKAETFILGMGAAALTWEAVAPDKSRDLLSHAADRHQVITAIGTIVLGSHLCNLYERVGLEQLDIISHIGKRFSARTTGDVEG